ncbi:RraA family protein [Amaricoccus sp.]|uniref:RraA family protein n=1 Tax=Amaricoccus sp. TaxID=1872485 RepID=UPI001B67D070|nr:RraA family protein [Amaricoccus sp.]MBP7003043.1 RraA family protein [Amaricoccus sp.]
MTIEKNPSAPSVAPELLERLRDLQVALISDQLHRNQGFAGLRPYHKPSPLAGTAVTVRTRAGDNLAILRAFEFCRPGDVMVVDADGDCANALVGGILTFYAASIGMAGMVLNGAIRDTAEIAERTFPVYAAGHTHRGPYKDGPGAINVPVTLGGMTVRPGDIVVGDQDGLLAFPPEQAEDLIAKAIVHREKEEATIAAMKAGRWDRAFIDTLEARAIN